MMNSLAPFAASTELRDALAEDGEPQLVQPGTVLFKQGDDVKGVYVVNSGKVLLSLTDSEGISAPDRTAQEGCVLGLPATMTGNGYTLTAKIQETAEVVFVPRESALALLRDKPALCFEVVEILAQEVSHMRHNAASALSAANN